MKTSKVPKNTKPNLKESLSVSGMSASTISQKPKVGKKVVDTYHASKGLYGPIVNKALGGRFG